MKPTVPLREEHRRLREQLARVEAAVRTPADVRADPPWQARPVVRGGAERGFDACKLLTQAPIFFS